MEPSVSSFSLKYPVYYFDGYGNEIWDLKSSQLEMIDIELSSDNDNDGSDDELLSGFELVLVDEYLVNNNKSDTSTQLAEQSNVTVAPKSRKKKFGQLGRIMSAFDAISPFHAQVQQNSPNGHMDSDKQKLNIEHDNTIAAWRPYLECVHCNALCVNFGLLKMHCELTHPNLECYIVCSCSKCKFYDKASFAEHIKVWHSGESKPVQKISKEVTLEEWEGFIKHYMSLLTCEVCKAVFRDYSSLREHFNVRHPGQRCFIKCCDRELQMPLLIVDHIRAHLDPNTFKCGFCYKFFYSKLHLDHHMFKQHFISIWPPARDYDHSEVSERNKSIARIRFDDLDEFIAKWRPALTCVQCFLRFSTFSILKCHFEERHPYNEFYVRCCDRKFKTRHDLEEHIHIHFNHKGFKCYICKWHLSSRFQLYQHLLSQHSFPKSTRHLKTKEGEEYYVPDTYEYILKTIDDDTEKNKIIAQEKDDGPIITHHIITDKIGGDPKIPNQMPRDGKAEEEPKTNNRKPVDNEPAADNGSLEQDEDKPTKRKFFSKLDALLAYSKRKAECGVCKEQLDNIRLLKQHFMMEHPFKRLHFSCCGKIMQYSNGYAYHLKRHVVPVQRLSLTDRYNVLVKGQPSKNIKAPSLLSK